MLPLTPAPHREYSAPARDVPRDNRKLEMEARRVGELQRSLLPQPLPRINGWEIAVSYEPCGHAGGDLYDFFPVDEGAPSRWCILVADATGHGLAAAVVIAMVQSILHAHPNGVDGAAGLLGHANGHLCRKGIRTFVTAFLGIYEPLTRRLVYSCAGHPPPLLKTAIDGKISRLDAVGNCPIGIHENETYLEASMHVGPGDTLLLYTDGITEARDRFGNLFSEKRLRAAFSECTERPADIVEQLERRISAHRRGQRATDDQVLVAVKGT